MRQVLARGAEWPRMRYVIRGSAAMSPTNVRNERVHVPLRKSFHGRPNVDMGTLRDELFLKYQLHRKASDLWGAYDFGPALKLRKNHHLQDGLESSDCSRRCSGRTWRKATPT